MRRSLLTLLISSTVLGLLALAPAPATALAGPNVAPTAGPPATRSAKTSGEVHPEWGSTAAPDARLRRGCRSYGYSYAVTPPEGDWSLETFLVAPHGRVAGSGYFVTGADPLAGPGAFRLCRRATKGGRYTIRALLTVQNGADYYQGWLPETTFRLRKHRR